MFPKLNWQTFRSVLRINEDKLMLSMMIYVCTVYVFTPVFRWNFLFRNASNTKRQRFLDMWLFCAHSFIAFGMKWSIYFSRCVRMTLIHHIVIMYHHHVPVLRQITKSTRATILPVIHISSFFLRRFLIAHFRSHTRPEAHSIRRKIKTIQQNKMWRRRRNIHFEQTIHYYVYTFFSPSIVNFAWTLTQYGNCMYARAYKRQC